MIPNQGDYGKVRTNHFRVTIKNIPTIIFQYHVTLTQLDRDGKVRMVKPPKKEGGTKLVECEICSDKSKMRDCYLLVHFILQQVSHYL